MPAISVKAGRSIRRSADSNHVDAQPAKGRLEVSVTEDGLLSLTWKSRECTSSSAAASEDDEYILFPGDCTFTKCTQDPSGRTHVLKFGSSDQRVFYWFQDASGANDELYASNIQSLIQDPDFQPRPIPPRQPSAQVAGTAQSSTNTASAIPFTPAPNASNSASTTAEPATPRPARIADFSSSSAGASGPDVVGETPAPFRAPPAAAGGASRELGAGTSASNSSSSSEFSQEQVSALARAMQMAMGGGGGGGGGGAAALQQQDEPAQLSDILTPSHLMPVFRSDPSLLRSIAPHLPSTLTISSPPTNDELESILSSPQWTEAVQGFDAALRTGGLSGFMSGVGLPSRAGLGVGEFLEEVMKQQQSNKEDEGKGGEGAASSGDKMETD